MPSELCHTLALLGVARVVVGELLRYAPGPTGCGSMDMDRWDLPFL
jgi:hypothetical protein